MPAREGKVLYYYDFQFGSRAWIVEAGIRVPSFLKRAFHNTVVNAPETT